MKKKLSILASIMIIIILIVTITYAFIEKNVFTQNVNFTISGLTVTYSAGPDISGVKLFPVTTLQKGLTDGLAIEKQITVSSAKTTYFNLYLDVEILDNGLKRDYVVWQIKKGNDIVNSGNFANSNVGDTITLLNYEEINSTTSIYTLYIWIDGSVDNDEYVENQDYKFVLRADATDAAPVLANEKIISLSQGATCNEGASGVYATNAYDDNGTIKYHEYRYIGAEPNNYVKFNDDLYQIIGVFDKNSYDIASVTNNNYGDYLIKLIAVNPLTSMSWGVYNTTASSGTYSNYANDWTGSVTGVPASANVMLNQYFLNSDTLTTGYTNSTYGACSNWTYMSSNNKNQNCNTIVGYGIKSSLSNYIETVTWYLKGFNSTSYTRGEFYNCERGITTGDSTKDGNCNSGSTGTADSTTNAKIGLMYVSDYAYASGNFACNNTQLVNASYMGNRNWLYKGYEWTITPRGDSATYAFDVNNDGYVNNGTHYGYGLRPTFYLKSSIKIKSGDGTFENPYIIG